MRESKYNIVVLGLDGSGKSRAILRLAGDLSSPPKASWGFNSTTIKLAIIEERYGCWSCLPFYSSTRQMNLTFYDVGGHEKIRKIWPNYYADVYGCVFVIDVSDMKRYDQAKDLLHEMALNPLMIRKPILMFVNLNLANRADNTFSAKSFCETFALNELIDSIQNGLYPAKEALIFVQPCDLDDKSLRLKQGIHWLRKAIEINYSKLGIRVAKDLQDQQQKWKQEKLAKLSNISEKQSLKSNKIYPE